MANYFCFNANKIDNCETCPEKFGMGILSFDELEKVKEFGLNCEEVRRVSNTKYTSYERKENCQYLILNTPTTKDPNGMYEKILIFSNMRGILIFSERGEELAGIVDDFRDKLEVLDIPHFYAAFLSSILSHDYIYMEGIEKDLGKVETEILSSHTPNYPEKINSYRRKVAVIKRYYEQLYEVSEVLVKEDWLKSASQEFSEINQKVARLKEDALYLRDYMSQVREAYQQAVDLSLNSIMKFLSALTLLFSPLTFLVGWYGMNFQMPETETANGYVLPFALTAVVIMVGVFIFKKRKWL